MADPTAEATDRTGAEQFEELRLSLGKDAALALSVVLDERDPLPDLAGYYEILYQEARSRVEPQSQGVEHTGSHSETRTTLVLYFPLSAAVEGRLALELLLLALGTSDYSIAAVTLDRTDYLETYKEFYEPFRIGQRLSVIPSWYRKTAAEAPFLEADRVPLYFDPGLAFGTGAHPTTRMCLEFLEANAETIRGKPVIDAGCGSGILALAAALLGAGPVLAFDVDGNAVRATQQNAAHNPLALPKIECLRGGFDLEPVQRARACLLMGNLVENIIRAEQTTLNRIEADALLLSGLLSEQAAEIAGLFPGHRQAAREDRDGWAMLYLVKDCSNS